MGHGERKMLRMTPVTKSSGMAVHKKDPDVV